MGTHDSADSINCWPGEGGATVIGQREKVGEHMEFSPVLVAVLGCKEPVG